MPAGGSPLFTLVSLHGEYELARQEELRSELAAADHAEVALLDMRDVTYIDAAALVEFTGFMGRKPGRAVVRMMGVAQNVFSLLHAAGLDKVFEVHKTLKGALGVGDATS
jgi:anti-anti-sigma factor